MESLNPDQLPALISLLDEPDEKSFSFIREQIFLFGEAALDPLTSALNNSLDGLVHDRIGKIIQEIRQEKLRHQVGDWMQFGSSDLLKGFLLISQTGYPDLNEEDLLIKIEQLRADAWLELNDNLTALETVKVLNHVLFGMHKFEPNRVNLTAPSNQYLNTLLETRKGNPLTLGMLYLILAHRLHLPIHGVNLPQHFILAYLTDIHSPHPTGQEVLFYINPFNQGAVFTRREIELFLRQMKLKPDPSCFAPCTNVDIIHRLLHSLVHTYTRLGSKEKVEELNRLIETTESMFREDEGSKGDKLPGR